MRALPAFGWPVPVVVAANIGLCGVCHAVPGYAVHRLPLSRLTADGAVLRLRSFERDGRFYERLRIGRWKERLPEAGALFPGGLSKRTLPGADHGGIERFAAETRRAERGHWWSLIAVPLSGLWNPPAGVAAMAAYGLAVNLPCIAVQRYNRARCDRILARRAERSSRTSPPPPGTSLRTSGSSMP